MDKLLSNINSLTFSLNLFDILLLLYVSQYNQYCYAEIIVGWMSAQKKRSQFLTGEANAAAAAASAAATAAAAVSKFLLQ